jgi:hypothetical protein
MPYVREIRPNTPDSHQTSPGYCITILRWSNRDTFNYKSIDGQDVRQPLVIINDAIQIVVSNTKKGLTPTVTVVLKGGDLNYATAVHPGDLMLVNMLNWEKDARRIYDKAVTTTPINGVGDGFKGLFRIQNVVKDLRVDPNSGIKTLFYTVTGAGFTEFNNVIYYNPSIAASFRDKGALLWSVAIGEFYQDRLKTNSKIQPILKDLFKILIGKSRKKFDAKIRNYGNTHFKVPRTLGALLGKNDAEFATDIFNYVLGVWKDSAVPTNNSISMGVGFNPSITSDDPKESNFFSTGTPLQGNKEVFLENWNQNTAWSIINGYLNNVLNEMYTTYRVDINNRVMPTVVVRQKPFTTEHFVKPAGNFPVSKFLSLPRWKISASLLLSQQTSKNEAARHNLVQVFTRALADTAEMDMSQQIALGNFVFDDKDIERQGLRPYIVTSNFDFPVKEDPDGKRIRAREWAKIVSDWIIDGHLKESGTFTFLGIQDPISVGDNLEFDSIVYQIEGITHTMTVNPSNGKKSFRTKIDVSYGMDKRSSVKGPVYANMEFTDAWTTQIEDYDNERILPGIGDIQDIPFREKTKGEEVGKTPEESFTLIDTPPKRQKTSEPNTGLDYKHGSYDGGKSKGKKE